MSLTFTVIESAFATSNHYLAVSLVRALRANPNVSEVIFCDMQDALFATRNKMTDVLLVFGGEQADGHVVLSLRHRSRMSIIWYLEDPYETAVNRTTRKYFDIALSNDADAAQQYGSNSYHFPLAGDGSYTDVFVPFADRRFDISFIGTAWPNRAVLLNEIRDELSTLRSRILVVDNKFTRPHLEEIGFKFPLCSGVDYRDFMRIAQQSRVSLMIDRSFSGSGGVPVSDTPGPRFFEAGAAGACLFVDQRVVGEQLQDLGFTDGREYFGFSDAAGLKLLLGELKVSPERFEDSARSLQRLIALRHSYNHRVEEIVKLSLAWTTECHLKPVENVAVEKDAAVRVLALAHNLTPFGNFGGGELYLDRLVRGTQALEVFTLAHDGRRGFGSRYVLIDGAGKVLEEFLPRIPFSDLKLTSPDVESFFLRCCEIVGPSVLLVNHLMGFPPSLPLIAKHFGLPFVLVLHDYYVICDSYNLLNHQGIYCRAQDPTDDFCDLCTYKRRNLSSSSQFRRRVFLGKLLENSFGIVANSPVSVNLVESLSGANLPAVQIIPPPRVHKYARSKAVCVDQPAVTLRRIALLGNLSSNKGMWHLLEIIRDLRSQPVSFEIFGRVDESFRSELNKLDASNVRIHGVYTPGELPPDLANCEVALFLSIWPETYCMSLTEALDAGVVPIAYNIGAIGERVDDEVGFKTEVDPAKVSELLLELIDDPSPLIVRKAQLLTRISAEDRFVSDYEQLLLAAAREFQTPNFSSVSKFDVRNLGFAWIPSRWDQDSNWDNLIADVSIGKTASNSRTKGRIRWTGLMDRFFRLFIAKDE